MKNKTLNPKPDFIEQWIQKVINGTGGFKSFERYELPVFDPDRESGIAEFVIKALGNPDCEGSTEVLTAILKNRIKK